MLNERQEYIQSWLGVKVYIFKIKTLFANSSSALLYNKFYLFYYYLSFKKKKKKSTKKYAFLLSLLIRSINIQTILPTTKLNLYL